MDVLVIGAGTAGVTIAARLKKARRDLKITVIDPSEVHHYQPLFTLVGGGLATYEETRRTTASIIPRGVNWRKASVARIDAEAKQVVLESGTSLQYDALVVAPGIRIALDEVDGLAAALRDDPRVWTNYLASSVEKGKEAIDAFAGGRALFTFPQSPVKCGGGPQKIMWIIDDVLRRRGDREGASVHYFAPSGVIFGVPRYCEPLDREVESRDIQTHFKQHLVAVDHTKSTATFELVDTGERVEEAYDLLHVTPPQRAQTFISESGIGNDAGFVEVDRHTLQHVRHPAIFSAGDACSAPTPKTGAAVRKQAPVLVKNLVAFLEQRELSANYDGYTSCPLVVRTNRVILAEFGYDGSILETFPMNQAKPRWTMWILKRFLLPIMYWMGMLKGRA